MTDVKGIAFDLDGTLYNSTTTSYDAILDGFREFSARVGADLIAPDWDMVKRLIGTPSHQFFPALLPEKYKDKWKILQKGVSDSEVARLERGDGRTYDGVYETLDALKSRGYLLGCLTNASGHYFNTVLDECDLRKYFDVWDCLGMKPGLNKSDVLKDWIPVLGGPDSLFYVGDRDADIHAAHYAGIEAVGFLLGYGYRQELEVAESMIDHFPDLMRNLTSAKRMVFKAANFITWRLRDESEDLTVSIKPDGTADSGHFLNRLQEELMIRNHKFESVSGDKLKFGTGSEDEVEIRVSG
ncbi:MAG TPA: HAD family hydrolase [bacterium]|jgi:phosphoglycolate phosphatase